MNNYIFITIIGMTLLAIGVFSGVNKGLKTTFDLDPAENAYQSEEKIDKQSERASSIREKNENLMQSVRDKMDRLKKN